MIRSALYSLTAVAVASLVACAEVRDTASNESELWPDEPESAEIDEEIAFADRADGQSYGLPRDGMQGISDLFAVFPDEGLSGREPNIFVSPDLNIPTDQCRGGAPVIVPELPMTIEAVVTMHPRQYMKVEVCGQDERHYGVYTIEDDTGGLIVLRDSRVAPFTFGDTLRLTVEAVTLTFNSEVDTRAILVADVEVLEQAGSQPVLFETLEEPFSTEHVGSVHEIEGYVHVESSQLNFNSLVITSDLVSQRSSGQEFTGDLLQCVRTCEVQCIDRCPSAEACADICPDACVSAGTDTVDPDTLPVCWQVGIASELGRRGFAPPYGTPIRIRGPIVNSFDIQMWVISPGQVEER